MAYQIPGVDNLFVISWLEYHKPEISWTHKCGLSNVTRTLLPQPISNQIQADFKIVKSTKIQDYERFFNRNLVIVKKMKGRKLMKLNDSCISNPLFITHIQGGDLVNRYRYGFDPTKVISTRAIKMNLKSIMKLYSINESSIDVPHIESKYDINIEFYKVIIFYIII